jgi:hypothetical protein
MKYFNFEFRTVLRAQKMGKRLKFNNRKGFITFYCKMPQNGSNHFDFNQSIHSFSCVEFSFKTGFMSETFKKPPL